MNMVEIQPKILAKLKCVKCEKYLNSLPISIKENGDSICGRCVSKSDTQSYRNTAYEDVAKMLLFPCRFKKDGCLKKLTVTEVDDHEESCEYQKITCPSKPIDSCKWTRFSLNLLQHFREKHNDLRVDHPYRFNHDVNISNEKNVLIHVFGFLFLIQTKYNIYTERIYYSVQLIDQTKIASQFKYYLQITKNEMAFSSSRILVEQLLKSLQDTKNSLEFDTKALSSLFNGLKDLSYCLTIIRHEHKCISCEETITETNTNITIDCATFCDKCNPNSIDKSMQPCILHMDGCTYQGNDKNMPKHTQWFCKYAINKCQFCNKLFKTSTRIFHLLHTCNEILVIHTTVLTNECDVIEKPIIFCINIFSKEFYCILSKKRNTLSINVVTPYTKEEMINFSIETTVTSPEKSFKNHRLTMTDEANCDWKSTFNVENFPCKVKFIIKKNK